MLYRLGALALIVVLAVGTSAVFAGTEIIPVPNGGFEAGTYATTPDHWDTVGGDSIQTASYGIAPTEGTYDSLSLTGTSNGAVSDVVLESFLGIPGGSLDIGGITRDGSGIKQTIVVNPDDVLRFDWNFATQEIQFPNGNPDYAFFVVVGIGAPQVFVLGGNTAGQAMISGSPSGFAHQIGWQLQYEYTFTQGGPVTIGFGVVDINSTTAKSGLFLDNVDILRIPEPSIGSLALLALLGLARRRNS
jgi:hypothetical protein